MAGRFLFSRAGRLLAAAACRVLHVQRVLFFETRLQPAQANGESRLGELRLFVARQADIERFATQLVAVLGLGSDLLEARLDRGNVLLLATHQDQVVAMLWMTFGRQRVSEVGSALQPRPGEFITFDALTLPAYRGLGISTALNRLACSHAAAQDAVRQLAWRRTNNRPALRVAQKLGQTHVATATAVWLFGHRVYFALDSVSDSVLSLLA